MKLLSIVSDRSWVRPFNAAPRPSPLAPRPYAFILLVIFATLTFAQAPGTSSVDIKTTPDAVIWVDHLRYGAVPATGEFTIANLRPGNHSVRARLKGKHEVSKAFSLSANERRAISIDLSVPADKAELLFQGAEELRESGKHADAIVRYKAAIKLRPRGLIGARLGIARSMQVTDQYSEAFAHLEAAMREAGGPLPEAHSISGNLKRAQGFADAAIKSYETALAQARGNWPEAHTGLALVNQDRNQLGETIYHLNLAIMQSNNTQPVLYFLLANVFEREARLKEAVDAYEKYLALVPEGAQSASARSIVKQLRREIR